MSTHKNSFDLLREKQDLDAFLSDITQEGQSDLVHEKQELDSFLATIMGDESAPTPAADMMESGSGAGGTGTDVIEARTREDRGLSGFAAEMSTQPQPAERVISATPEPVSVPPDHGETTVLQDETIDVTEEASSAVDSEKEIPTDEVIEATSVVSTQRTVKDDDTEQEIESATSDVQPEADKPVTPVLELEVSADVVAEAATPTALQSAASDDDAGREIALTTTKASSEADRPVTSVLELEVSAEREVSEPPLSVAGAGESLAAETMKMDEVPVTDGSDSPHAEPAGPVLDEIEFVASEDHRPDEKESETSPDQETAGLVTPVMEKMEVPVSDFQRAAAESMLKPEENGDISMKKDQGSAETQDLAKSEPAETVLPAFIIRRETRVDDHPAPSRPEQDKTLELPKSIPVAKEPDITTTPSVSKDSPKTREEHVFGKSFNKAQSSWIRAGVLAAVLAAVVQGYVWLYPDAGQQAIRWMAANIPYFDQLVGVEQKREPTITQQIKFTDVRQRFVYNIPLSRNIRIVEGVAVNNATFPISTIKILGELYDARGTILASKVIYCGNILPDEKLTTLGEEEIKSALSIPQGNDLSNSKILPQGQIPFMIIFVQEPVGVVKTTIMPISAAGVSP
jgi:hypothetical protein